jgi:hypothetical protein
MTGFRVFMKPGGWKVTDGTEEHGPYPTYDQAMRTADNLNLHRRADEERSFAPAADRNMQAGVPLPASQHVLSPGIASGDRREGHLVPDQRTGEKVVYYEAPLGELPPNMVPQTDAGRADGAVGDVVRYPEGPSVWEALEEGETRQAIDERTAAKEARERAAVPSTDTPAGASASRGGGLV